MDTVLGGIIATFLLLLIYAGVNSLELHGRSSLTKGVAQEQIPVSGEKDFTAQVKIVYKDGDLSDVLLIKDTTKALTLTAATAP